MVFPPTFLHVRTCHTHAVDRRNSTDISFYFISFCKFIRHAATYFCFLLFLSSRLIHKLCTFFPIIFDAHSSSDIKRMISNFMFTLIRIDLKLVLFIYVHIWTLRKLLFKLVCVCVCAWKKSHFVCKHSMNTFDILGYVENVWMLARERTRKK